MELARVIVGILRDTAVSMGRKRGRKWTVVSEPVNVRYATGETAKVGDYVRVSLPAPPTPSYSQDGPSFILAARLNAVKDRALTVTYVYLDGCVGVRELLVGGDDEVTTVPASSLRLSGRLGSRDVTAQVKRRQRLTGAGRTSPRSVQPPKPDETSLDDLGRHR